MPKLMVIALMGLFLLTKSYSQNEVSVAVIPLKASGILKDEVELLEDRIRHYLVEFRTFKVIDKENMEEILKEQGFQLSGCTSDECIVQIGKILGVQKIISGSIGKFGNLYSMNVRLTSVESAEIESSTIYDHAGSREMLLIEGTKKVVNELLGKVPYPDIDPNKINYQTLGLSIRDTTVDELHNFSLQQGVFVTYVKRNSISEKAGLAKADIIYEADKNNIFTVQDFDSLLNKKSSRDVVRLKVRRMLEGEKFDRLVFINLTEF
jgi:TolB-like protein